MWRALAFFACCNIGNEELTQAITQLNIKATTPADEVFGPNVLKDYYSALNQEDMVKLADWIVENPTVDKVTLVRKLQDLRLRRWAAYHTYGADDGAIHPTIRMSFIRGFSVLCSFSL